jgi:outer membrane receptor protein involved in Fe transport
LSESDIDQKTAGSSRLLSDDFYNNPKYNYTPISYRKVEAFRLSMAYEKEEEDSLLSITPYFRNNSMDMLPNWSLSYDPVVYETENQSFGLMAKYRKDFATYRTRVIVGVDIDHSPGSRLEEEITPTKVGNVYTDYVKSGTTLYDYDVTYTGISPYIHVETSPTDNLRVNAGLRYDDINYDYENHLSTLTTGNHRRPASQEVNFSRVSPKLGATYQFSENLNAFASYREAFRAPGEGQLFKQGKSVTPAGLQPVKVDSYEIGIRGKAMDKVRYEVSLYRMEKKDDILTYTYPDNTRESMNAGETQHEGIEIGLGVDITDDLTLDVAYSYAEHTYEDWKPKAGVDYSGNDIASAPRVVANTKLNYSPQLLNGGKVGLEWTHLGKYWMDDANTHEYNGYDVINLRANYRIGKSWDIFGRVLNLNDKRYATAAKYTPAGWDPEKFEYSPGMPRTFYAGLTYKWTAE